MRSVRRALLTVFVITALAPPAAFARQHRQPEQPSDVTLGATEVTLDVSARDRRGRSVTDLKAEDLSVTEDGKPQEITSFRLVRPGAAAPTVVATQPAGPDGAPAPPEEPRSLTTAPEDTKAIAIVFDSLTPPARALAFENAKKYVEQNFRPGDAVGVFAVDLSLVNIQPYTTDRAAVLAGIQAAGEHAGATYAQRRDSGIRRPRSGGAQSTDVEATISTGAGSGAGAPGQGAVDAKFDQMRTQTSQGFEALQRLQSGYATTNSLLAIIEGLSLLPGRKAMLFFSEGISVPNAVERNYDEVISNANQARVSVYTVDAAGLRITSTVSEAAAAAQDYGAGRMDEIGTPGEGHGGSMLRGMESIEASLNSTPGRSLGRLAKETGGYFVQDTNGIAARLRRVDDDLRTYYVVTYAPTNANYDGSFRRVAVSVHRSGVDVRTREGYYAINVTNAPPVLAYEAPAIAAATATTSARSDFAIRALATSFPESDRPGLSPVIVSVPARSATFMQNAKKKSFSTALSVVVFARDESGQIVAKTSKQFLLTGPLDALPTTQSGDLLYYAELDLAPGRYTIDAVAYDAPTQKASVRRMPLVVAAASDDGPRLSSVTIVDRAEALTTGENVGGEPFRVGDALLYPNLGKPLSKTADGKLAFFVTVYVGENVRQAPAASVEIAQAGATLKTLPIELPVPDAQGRIQYTNAFALDALGPGTYELRVTVGEGSHSETRSTRFTIAG